MAIARTMGTVRADIAELTALVGRFRRDVTRWELRTGRWFHRLVEEYLERHEERRGRLALERVPEDERPARSDAIIRTTAGATAVSGLCAGSMTTAATVSTSETGGAAAVVVFPLAGVAVAADLLLRSLLQLRMTCDLADLYGLPFGPEHVADISSLYALALGTADRRDDQPLGEDLVERLASTEEHQLGEAVGDRLVNETVLRNVVPFLGVALSPLSSWRLTTRIGRSVRRYLALRLAVLGPYDAIHERCPECVPPLLEGMWAVLAASGPPTGAEATLLTHLVRKAELESREPLTAAVVPRPVPAWIDRLAGLGDPVARAQILRVLEVAAAAGRGDEGAETDLLERAASVLGGSVDPEELEEMSRTLAQGRPLPVAP